LAYVAVAGLVGVICFLAPLLTYGFGAFTYTKGRLFELTHLPYYAVYSVGFVPALLMVIGLLGRAPELVHNLRQGDPLFVCCTSAVAVVAILFCLTPFDPSYLLPLFPFLLLLLDRLRGRRFMIALALFCWLFGFVMIQIKDTRYLEEIRIRPHLEKGLVWQNYTARKQQQALRAKIAPFLRERYGGETPALIVGGWQLGHQQLYENPDVEGWFLQEDRGRRSMYRVSGTEINILVGPITEPMYRRYGQQGIRLVFIEGALRGSRQAYGFTVPEEKIEVLAMEDIRGWNGRF
jgi:hypothetical protein